MGSGLQCDGSAMFVIRAPHHSAVQRSGSEGVRAAVPARRIFAALRGAEEPNCSSQRRPRCPAPPGGKAARLRVT